MTRLSHYLLPTEREAPADAEAVSHKLMVRAGLVRQVGAGLWTWLPAGWRVHQKIVAIIREEMDAIGGQELLMPLLQPADAWRRTGRYGVDELFKLRDRKEAEMVLAMTHEEAVTTHAAGMIRSYRDLPQTVYQFQVKERDEARPRAGVLRTREFVMKDSYSFDRDAQGLDLSYDRHAEAYAKIFDRCGIVWYRALADVGLMYGRESGEYMAPCAAGENDVVIGPNGYVANLEVASADAVRVELPPALPEPEAVSTPDTDTIESLAAFLTLPAAALTKAFPVVKQLADGSEELVLILLRGDHRVNDVKLRRFFGSPFRQATAAEIADRIGPPGYLGPVGMRDPGVRVVLDAAIVAAPGGYVAGANRADTHLRGVQAGRDFTYELADLREVTAADTIGGEPIRIEPAIEVGNIFKLDDYYSAKLGANYLDANGVSRPVFMGSYGIGPARVAAAAVEQFADTAGISWPRAIAPFDVHLVSLGKPGSPERELADDLYERLAGLRLDVIYDDRDAGAGEKFADAELLGCPLRVTVSRRGLAAGELEVQRRRGAEMTTVPIDGAAEAVAALWRTLP
ncbi:proline--tRNA ligase [Conexibacter sp. DBS9H8]|uniref:proline--tRNA ligase n=1 Tax=Conexibacter sp. DBS9H8 TaxID=2937801 RepID=UPI00200CEFFB|nr:proline--tRNA ligase [Conexibacter sp. DBS9H8]